MSLLRNPEPIHPATIMAFLSPSRQMPKECIGRAMAQTVSCQPLTAEAWVPFRASPCGIYGGQSGTGTGFSPRTSVFPCQFQSTGAPLHGQTKK